MQRQEFLDRLKDPNTYCSESEWHDLLSHLDHTQQQWVEENKITRFTVGIHNTVHLSSLCVGFIKKDKVPFKCCFIDTLNLIVNDHDFDFYTGASMYSFVNGLEYDFEAMWDQLTAYYGSEEW
jgi:hypothetical protein